MTDKLLTYVVALVCVIAIAGGQVLFKLCAILVKQSGSFLEQKALFVLFSALAVYGVTTFGWIWVLQRVNLGKVYPINAFAFILVPIASHYFFAEGFSSSYVIGVAFIVFGLLLVLKN